MTLRLGDVVVAVTRKGVKNVHLSVHPPDGKVTLIVPKATRLNVARAYAISKLGWIREQRVKLRSQARETSRQFIERESHYLWGRRYLLSVVEDKTKPKITLDHRRITLTVRPGTVAEKRANIVHEWHKSLLHAIVPALIKKWEPLMGVTVSAYFLQRMKTKWGGCNHRAGHIRLNTELVKKPKALLEYVLVHEMLHLRESTHNERFVRLLARYYPAWREARLELNELPLSQEAPSASKIRASYNEASGKPTFRPRHG